MVKEEKINTRPSITIKSLANHNCSYLNAARHVKRGEDQHKSSRTRDESQQIAVQDYSHAYNTPFKSSRLQGISVCHFNRFDSFATPNDLSIERRIANTRYDP